MRVRDEDLNWIKGIQEGLIRSVQACATRGDISSEQIRSMIELFARIIRLGSKHFAILMIILVHEKDGCLHHFSVVDPVKGSVTKTHLSTLANRLNIYGDNKARIGEILETAIEYGWVEKIHSITDNAKDKTQYSTTRIFDAFVSLMLDDLTHYSQIKERLLNPLWICQ